MRGEGVIVSQFDQCKTCSLQWFLLWDPPLNAAKKAWRNWWNCVQGGLSMEFSPLDQCNAKALQGKSCRVLLQISRSMHFLPLSMKLKVLQHLCMGFCSPLIALSLWIHSHTGCSNLCLKKREAVSRKTHFEFGRSQRLTSNIGNTFSTCASSDCLLWWMYSHTGCRMKPISPTPHNVRVSKQD